MIDFFTAVCNVTYTWNSTFSFLSLFYAELETRVMGLSYSEDPVIVAGVVLTQCQRVTDRRTDRRTDLR